MPSGRVHFEYLQTRWPRVITANVLLFVLVFAVRREWIWYALEFNALSLFWFWMARYIDPDLDQPGVTEAEGRITRELGLVGVFLAAYAAFYAHFINYIKRRFKIKGGLFGAHQSKLTHSPLGTLIRVLFLAFPIPAVLEYWMVAVNMVYWGPTLVLNIATVDWFIYFAAQIITLGYSDAVHVWMDKTYGEDPRNGSRVYAQR